MIEKIRTIFSIPDLRSKIFYTLSILIVVRVGAHVPIPGVDANALAGAFERLQDTLFGLFNMFVGGAFEKASLFTLGIMPYISSSIIIQLMGSVLPYFQRLQKEGEEGRKKLNIDDGMIRLSIGLEDIQDLVEDIDQAFGKIN